MSAKYFYSWKAKVEQKVHAPTSQEIIQKEYIKGELGDDGQFVTTPVFTLRLERV